MKNRWRELIRMIQSGTMIINEEHKDDIARRRAALENDPEAWFCYYFPKFAYAAPSAFHIAASQRVLDNAEWCEVRMWSRELAKSTRTMMEVFYLVFAGHRLPDKEQGEAPAIVTDALRHRVITRAGGGTNTHNRMRKRCVLMISNSVDNAARLLMPYRANLQYNKRLIQDYGQQAGTGTWTSQEFITTGGASFRAVGAGQSPRGTRNEEARPDILLFDDVDTDAECLNTQIVAPKWHWIEEAAIGTRSVSMPTTIIFCGNRIAQDCCITRAADIADYAETVNIRDSNGISVWPEKNSETDIDRVLSQKSYAAQQKEYFNNPLTEGSVFSELAWKPAKPLNEYDALICYTDPSYKDTCDYKATVLIGRAGTAYHVLKCYLEQTTTARMIAWLHRIAEYVNGMACTFYMEEVFMQDVIINEVNEASKRAGIKMWVKGDSRKKPNKYVRIEGLLEPMVRNCELYLSEEERHNPHMLRLVEQFRAFAAGSNAHDDGPDAVEGAIWILKGQHKQADTRIYTSNPIRTGRNNGW